MRHDALRLLQRGAPPVSVRDHATRRDREVNWGDRTRLEGHKSQTLAWVSLDDAEPLVVYAAATVRGAQNVICVVSLEWGHGGASVMSDYPVVKRLRVPLVASMAKLSGRLVDATTGTAPAASVVADVSAFIARGLDGETLRNTRWLHQTGSAGTIATGPQRVMRVEGFNAGAADTFIHVNDGAPTSTSAPAILALARAGRRFVVRRFDSQAFVQSVAWAASSSAFTFAPDKHASVRVDVELLL
jgi:hypothetical protein